MDALRREYWKQPTRSSWASVSQLQEAGIFSFTGETDDKGRMVGSGRFRYFDPRQGLVFEGWALHRF
jgi:hypothetical protein